MNSGKYISILKDHVKADMEKLNCQIYQDDSAPCHRSKETNSWKDSNDIISLDWPGNSPDLNPIEHLWRIFKYKLRLAAIYDKKMLLVKSRIIWESLSADHLKNLIESIPKRIYAVIENKGGNTKY